MILFAAVPVARRWAAFLEQLNGGRGLEAGRVVPPGRNLCEIEDCMRPERDERA